MFEIIKKEQVFLKPTKNKPFTKGQKVFYRNQLAKIKKIISSPLKGTAYELDASYRSRFGLLIVSESEIRPFK